MYLIGVKIPNDSQYMHESQYFYLSDVSCQSRKVYLIQGGIHSTSFTILLQIRISHGALLSNLAGIVKSVMWGSQIYDFVSYSTSISKQHKYTWFHVLSDSFKDETMITIPLRLSPRMVRHNLSRIRLVAEKILLKDQ
jgi:hypothetical protein